MNDVRKALEALYAAFEKVRADHGCHWTQAELDHACRASMAAREALAAPVPPPLRQALARLATYAEQVVCHERDQTLTSQHVELLETAAAEARVALHLAAAPVPPAETADRRIDAAIMGLNSALFNLKAGHAGKATERVERSRELLVELLQSALAAPPAEAQQPVSPMFAVGVAARKWAALQADGYRMQTLNFSRSIDGAEQAGSINPWGVVRWAAPTAPTGAPSADPLGVSASPPGSTLQPPSSASASIPDANADDALLEAAQRKIAAGEHMTKDEANAHFASGLFNPTNQVYFRAGLIACREYMARFVEAESPGIAASIRANWWPQLGDDLGAPRRIDWNELVASGDEFPVVMREDISPTLEALPVALSFFPADAQQELESRARSARGIVSGEAGETEGLDPQGKSPVATATRPDQTNQTADRPLQAAQTAAQEGARDPYRGGDSYEASMLRNLLARIHRDGGHYVEEHGLDKALEDADAQVCRWLGMSEGIGAIALRIAKDSTYRHHAAEALLALAAAPLPTPKERP